MLCIFIGISPPNHPQRYNKSCKQLKFQVSFRLSILFHVYVYTRTERKRRKTIMMRRELYIFIFFVSVLAMTTTRFPFHFVLYIIGTKRKRKKDTAGHKIDMAILTVLGIERTKKKNGVARFESHRLLMGSPLAPQPITGGR